MNKIYSINYLLLLLFLQQFFSGSANAQQPLTLSSPTTGEYSSTVGIILAPGFRTNGPFHAYITNILSGPLASAPSLDQNYIRVKTYKIPSTVELNDPQVNQQSEVIQYFDGLGRLVQTIQTKGSPAGNDIVQPVQYDAFGREVLKFLPYAGQSGNGSYKPDAFTTQSQFYSTLGWDASVVKTTSPYSQTIFEASPLNRLIEQGAPGGVWQPASSRSNTTGRTVVVSYGLNDASTAYSTSGYAVRLWNAVAVSGQTYKRNLTTSGNYDTGQLYLKVTKDENWTSADGKAGTIEEYTDKDGHVVLKRTFNTDLSVLSTYYVYDDFGNLSFVLSPGANPDAGSISQTVLDQFCYQYRYDGRSRVIEKKIPGKGWDQIVYNNIDQIVLTQDSVQRGNSQWIYNKYDGLGRNVMTGLYANGSTRATLEYALSLETVYWETPQATGIGYTSVAFPQTVSSYFTINYYDNYNFPGAVTYTYGGSENTKGLLTGSKTGILGSSDLLLGINYYDEEGRPSKIYKQHYQSGAINDGNYDEISNSYNFEGMLTASTRLHHNSVNGNTTVATRYGYDHVGRKLSTYESINAEGEVLLSANTYNEIGQLKSKAVGGGLQSTSYSYNERGWLKTSTSPQLSFRLNYQDGTTPQFNGNISTQLWGPGNNSQSNNFEYGYDKLNRLLSGVSIGMSEKVSYDAMGNINTMNRDEVTRTYIYTGNMLSSTSGAPGTGTYQYDGNGNTVYDGRNEKSITYNILNLPSAVSGMNPLTYIYDGAGNKLRKKVGGTANTATDYVDGIQYEGGKIQFIQTQEGIARRNGTSYSYEYNLLDHLGNVRYTFYRNPVTQLAERLQSDDYYPFGLRRSGSPLSLNNKYLYNGKELQDELGQYDYGARFYDPVIGRFSTVDPLAEKMRRYSPYNYAFNNPISFIDPDGMAAYPIITITGQIIGKAQQRVLGYSNSPGNPGKYATTTVNVYRAIVTDTEDANYHMEFGVTRDAFAVTKSSYVNAWNGKGDGPRNASNVAFEPANGKDNTYEASEKSGGFPSGAAAALYLTKDGDTELPSTSRNASVELGFGDNKNSADGVMFHVGGYYNSANGKSSLAASEACFGIVNIGNSPSNPSNSMTNTVVNSVVSQANKSQTNPGLIQVTVEKRNQIQNNKNVQP